MVTCAVCHTERNRVHRSLLGVVPFICSDCRCQDCQIVLSHDVCTVPVCQMKHGEPSSDDPGVCAACVEIRKRVADMDDDARALRISETALEPPFGS